MPLFQKESGSCVGSGFGAGEFLGKLKAWVVKALAAGGPGWTIIDDQSTQLVLNFLPADVNITTEIITITDHGLWTGQEFTFETSGTVIGNLGISSYLYAIKVDDHNIKVASSLSNALAGTAINLTSTGTGTHTIRSCPFIVVSNEVAPTVNQVAMFVKISQPNLDLSYVRAQCSLWHNAVTHLTYAYWAGYRLAVLSDLTTYFYDFRGGPEQLIIQSRIAGVWTTIMIDLFVGATELGDVGNVGVLQEASVSGSNVVLQLNTGEAANFDVDGFYFIYDFQDQSLVNYVKATAVDAINDTITVDSLTAVFPAGAVIAAYAHRFYAVGNSFPNEYNFCSSSDRACQIPYYSGPAGKVFHGQTNSIYSQVTPCKNNNKLLRCAPDDNGAYAIQQPELGEYRKPNDGSIDGTMNRVYGYCKNMFIASSAGMMKGQDGRADIDTGLEWLYFQSESDVFGSQGSSSYATLFLDTVGS